MIITKPDAMNELSIEMKEVSDAKEIHTPVDITDLPLLEFQEVYDSGIPCTFSISDLTKDKLRWLAGLD